MKLKKDVKPKVEGALTDNEGDIGPKKIPKGKGTNDLGSAGADLGEFGGTGADSGGTGAGATALDAIGATSRKGRKRTL